MPSVTSLAIPDHPFLHHKSEPSVPLSAHSALTFPNTDALPSRLGSPPPSVPSSHPRRHSKFTAFSGSSASSVFSSDSSSYHRHLAASGHHWGFADKADISTVVEEDPNAEVDIDLTGHHTKPDSFGESQRHRALDPPVELAPKDLDPRVDPLVTLSSVLQPISDPAHSQNQSFRSNDHSRRYSRPSRSNSVQNSQHRRAERSETISSLTSVTSGRSTKFVHPFASSGVHSSSPADFIAPHLTASSISRSRSDSNLLQASMAQVQAAPALQVHSSFDERTDEETCPVCVESLSFTYRLPGEKPHVVPECGHALHEVGQAKLPRV